VRRKCGGLGQNEVSDRELEPYVIAALEWLADELKYRVVTEPNAIALTASQFDYPVPDDLLEMIQVFWNGKPLKAMSVDAWDRVHTDWRHATGGNPTEYAIEGRRLFVTPPPSAAAVTSDSTLEIRYVASPSIIPPGGPKELTAPDLRLASWEAAYEWLVIHPSDENNLRAQGCATQIPRLLKGAKHRAQAPTRNHRPRFRPNVYRSGAAR
jgi:hypothetical protein